MQNGIFAVWQASMIMVFIFLVKSIKEGIMFFKERMEPKELTIFRSLHARMSLSTENKQYYSNLEKGVEGEKLFDAIIREELQNHCFVLNDLLLQHKNITFQVDAFFIFQNKLLFFEVKNFEGDYYYESDKLYTKEQRVQILNPNNQLGRTSSLLQQLLNSHGFNLPIEGYVVFVNPEFTLYQAPIHKPFIYPTQFKRYVRSLNEIPSRMTKKHFELANLLKSLHIQDSSFTHLPKYAYEKLKKGIICKHCHSLTIQLVKRSYCTCQYCGIIEKVDDAVYRSVQELRTLFPNKKLNTNLVHDWCKVVPSKRAIKRILDKYYQLVGVHQWAHYVEKVEQ